MAKQTAAQKAKAAAAKKVAQAQKAPATTTQTTPATTGATTQPAPGTTGQTDATPATSLIDQAVAFSMGEIEDETQAQAAFDLWDLMGCEALPPKLAVAVFDCAIQQGPKVCTRLLGKVGITANTAQDGSFDADALVDEIAERTEGELVIDFLAWRLRRYAFTAAASTKMLEWSQHILALQALIVTELEA